MRELRKKIGGGGWRGCGGGGALCEFRCEPDIYVVSDPNKY